ncbi:hypothetical protein CEXT_210391, partial [Caerostris extrusa]
KDRNEEGELQEDLCMSQEDTGGRGRATFSQTPIK